MPTPVFIPTRRGSRRFCLCGATDCPSCGPAQASGENDEAIQVIADSIFEQRRQQLAWPIEAMNDLGASERLGIASAYTTGDDLAIGRAMRAALDRILQRDALIEAGHRYERLCREDIEDAARERLEH